LVSALRRSTKLLKASWILWTMERWGAFDGWITVELFLQTMRDAGKEIHLEDGSTCQRRGSGGL
jgi:hypothetical protein